MQLPAQLLHQPARVALALPHHHRLGPRAVDDGAALGSPGACIHNKVQTLAPISIHERGGIGSQEAIAVVLSAPCSAAQQRAV